MNTGATILILNFIAIQDIPAPVWFVLNAGLVAGIWLQLKKRKVNAESLRITKHIFLLLGTWSAISICVGLLLTFELMESTVDARLFSSFLFGFRIAMVWMFVGGMVVGIGVWRFVQLGPRNH